MLKFAHSAGGVRIFYVTQMSQIKGHVIILLRDQYDCSVNYMGDTDLVKYISVAVDTVSDYDSGCADGRPNVKHDAVSGKEVICACCIESQTFSDWNDMIRVYRLKGVLERHQNEYVCRILERPRRLKVRSNHHRFVFIQARKIFQPQPLAAKRYLNLGPTWRNLNWSADCVWHSHIISESYQTELTKLSELVGKSLFVSTS